MNLFDLPLDIFLSILEQTVVTVSYREVARLRLVCKLFDAEIPRTICRTRLFELRTRPNVSEELTSLYLFQRVVVDGALCKGSFQAVIYDAVDTILQEEDARPSENLRREYLQALCKGAASYSGPLVFTSGLLAQGSSASYKQCPPESMTNSLFVAAAYLGKTALVSGLLQKDEASVSTPNLYLGSALRCAAMQGHYDTTRALLDVGADVNYCRLFKDFALGAAAFRGHRDVVELLLQPEYNCVLSGAVYEKAICRAARGGNLETMLFMIKRGKVEDSEDLIQTILGEAAGNGHESVVQWALENGALVHGNIDKLFQKSALNYAALNGHEPIVRLLLRREPYNFREALLQTMVGGSERTAQTVFDAMLRPNPYRTGWPPTLRGPFGVTCVIWAAKHGQTHMIHFLVRNGADLTQKGNGEMAMYYAARRGHISVVRALVMYGAAVNSPNPNRDPLGQARDAGNRDLVKLLIELGATRYPAQANDDLGHRRRY